jgi:hypothetical protein
MADALTVGEGDEAGVRNGHGDIVSPRANKRRI